MCISFGHTHTATIRLSLLPIVSLARVMSSGVTHWWITGEMFSTYLPFSSAEVRNLWSNCCGALLRSEQKSLVVLQPFLLCPVPHSMQGSCRSFNAAVDFQELPKHTKHNAMTTCVNLCLRSPALEIASQVYKVLSAISDHAIMQPICGTLQLRLSAKPWT